MPRIEMWKTPARFVSYLFVRSMTPTCKAMLGRVCECNPILGHFFYV
jgi:hypothetical protein